MRPASVGTKRAEPVLVRQRTMLFTLVDDWDETTTEERRKLIGPVSQRIHVDANGITRLLPRDNWKPYIQAILSTPRVGPVGY